MKSNSTHKAIHPPPGLLKTMLRLMLGCGTLLSGHIVVAAPPDLTSGGVPGDTISFNMGPTGARGWIYHVRENSSESRQIQIKSVASGSPSAGILVANDVILGVGGTGQETVHFTYDARRALADAINEAEARSPATLKLIRWRAGTTTTVDIPLQTMGSYSATAPYNCPKSSLILQRGLQAIMASGANGETAGSYSFGTLSLLAANNTSDPANAARITRAQSEARALVPTAEVRAQMMSNTRDATSMVTWERGHKLIVLAEYYLLTGDPQVLPGIEAYAVNIAKNSSLFGTMGHIFADKNADGSNNGPMGGVYGPVNSAGMPCFLGLLLARECGLANIEITPAIERMSRFYGYYAARGAVPYGEHEAYWQGHENNGKSGLGALCFHFQNNRVQEGKFFAKMATAATTEREIGHTGAFFNYVWAPLGAASGGADAAAAHFSGIRWMLDLNRRWDGKFEYDCLNGEGENSGEQYGSGGFRMSTAALLTYALPLRQLRITGKNHDSSRYLTTTEVSAAVAADGYSAGSRAQSQIIADLGSWSPMVQRRAAEQLATTSIDTDTLNQLTALANDPNGGSRIGACLALGKISNSSTANARAATLAALLADPQNHVRYMAAEAMRYLPDSAKLTRLNSILTAVASTAKPLIPFDEEDPLHFAHGRLAMLVFYSGSAYGPAGFLSGNKINSPTVIDRTLLYPAIRAVAENPIGMARGTLQQTYKSLTAADVNALAGTMVESVQFRAPSDKMFSNSIREGGLTAFEKYNIAEGVPLSIQYMVDDSRDAAYDYALTVLKNYAGGCTTVTPDPAVEAFCQSVLTNIDQSNNWPEARAARDAIAADTNPVPLTPFKSIQSVTADATSFNLPTNQTVLHVSATDLAEGSPVFTWRKVRGPGNVTFTPNGTADAKDSTVQIDNAPGIYAFEVTMSDARGLTEIRRTVEVTLYKSDGTLPTDNPPVAYPQFVNATPEFASPITLVGSDPEGHPVTYSVLTQPTRGTLTGTPPNLTYFSEETTYAGTDQFTFRGADVDLKTATGTVTIHISRAANKLLVYEPFNYATGGLDGKGGTTESGLADVWTASTSSNVLANSLSYGILPVSGGSIGDLSTGVSKFGGTRSISASLLAQNGLFNHGATLWFSAVVGLSSNANIASARLGLALSNSGFNTGDGQYYINNEGAQLGSGLGVTVFKSGRTGIADFCATQFRDSGKGTGTSGSIINTSSPITGVAVGASKLVVGKIVWGADSSAYDRVEIYLPATDMYMGTQGSTIGLKSNFYPVTVDQSTFDTITWTRTDAATLDEIRFGNTYDSVTGFHDASNDTVPPVLSNMDDNRSGAPLPVNTPVTYTVAFNENMDATTVGSSDFGNAGTAQVTIGPVYQTHPGVFSVQITPITTGSLRLRVNAGAVLKDLVGNPLDTTTAPADGVTLIVHPTVSTAPSVCGMPQENAHAAIASAALAVGTVTGQYHPSIAAGIVISQDPVAGMTVSAGSTINLVVSLGVSFAADHATWATTFLPADVTDPNADLDGDGLTNAEERLWGLDPANAASSNSIKIQLDPAHGTFSYTRRNPALTGYAYSVWFTDSLAEWTEDQTAGQSASDPDAKDIQTVVVTLSPEVIGGHCLFVQVRATPPPPNP